MSFNSNQGASASPTFRWKYDVFVSFRGEDTGKNLIDNLCKPLNQKGFIIFKDDDQTLERGKPISPELLKAIEQSRFSIVVFSRNYATSSRCLDELVKIVECMKGIGQTVVPVFYDVNPTEVRQQTGSFGQAFDEHKKAIGAEKVEKWRRALTEVTNLSGWALQGKHEATLIQNIVKDIWAKLSKSFSSVSEGLVGIDSILEEMNSYLEIGSNDVRLIGICGMGGIGKTTIARAIYLKLAHQFEGSSFVEDVRDVSETHGLVALQKQLLSETLMEENINLLDAHGLMSSRLRNRKVFIVLDDVNNLPQLKALAGDHEWFGPGSRIVITTRDERLLKAHDVAIRIYEPKGLNKNEALQLFSYRAFKLNHPPEDYVALSEDIVSYANGIPLALEVWGSTLYGRNVYEWRSYFELIKQRSVDEWTSRSWRFYKNEGAHPVSDTELSVSLAAKHLVAQVWLYWMFTIINLVLEVLSAAFDQLSSAHRRPFALYAMLISDIAMVFSIVEVLCNGMKAKVFWKRGKRWFYHRHPHTDASKPYFGTFKGNVGPLCALCQCIVTTINYTYTNKPIQILVWPIVYAFCQTCCKIVESRRRDSNVRRPPVRR